jgi:SAM-dependent methyltransferase
LAAALRHCKVCDRADFRELGLRTRLRQASGDHAHPIRARLRSRRIPERRELWETAMTMRSLDILGALGEETEVLTIGPGSEPLVYWLTERARRVFSTDVDRVEGAWSKSASGGEILERPELQWAGNWNPRRLVVQQMDPLNLRYEDESFGCVCSARTLERLDGLSQVVRAVNEIFRVIRPGGVAAISTAFRLEGPSPGPPGLLAFDEDELRHVFLDPEFSWALADLLETGVSAETLDGDLVLRQGDHLTTSVHLILVKPRQH